MLQLLCRLRLLIDVLNELQTRKVEGFVSPEIEQMDDYWNQHQR